jgi:rhodanese-related sulfurtransferase
VFHGVPCCGGCTRCITPSCFDVTTGACFYPIEIALSMLIKFAAIAVFGPPAVAGGDNLVRNGLIALAVLGALIFLPRLVRRLRDTPTPEQISASELKQRLARREDITVLDVRSARDYTGELGHIDAALNIPLDRLPQRLAELDDVRERPIAVICRTNRMSGQAAELLRRAGFKRVQVVADGMLGWQQLRDA